jgi:EmrB/QacA subfamily drug resistance transporter
MDSHGPGGPQAPPSATEPVPDPRRWKALALLCTAFFMVILDGAIVFVAIPSIKEDLAFSVSGVQWVLSAYLLTFGGLLLLGGRAADLLGRRLVFQAGLALFVVSSLFCGLAWSGEVLIGARAVQGISAAIMTPTALSILVTTFTDGAERNKALGIWSAVGGVGGVAGSLLGGTLTSGLGWEWIFFINVPVGLAMLALTPVLVRESRGHGQRSFDLPGAVTITAALVAIVYAIVKAPEVGWTSGQIIGLLVAAAVLLALFILIESRASAPLVPLRLFRSRTLVGGNLVMLIVGMIVAGAPGFILTQYAQQVLSYSPVEFGLMSAVMAALAVVGSITGQQIVTKKGFRPAGAAGMVLIGLSMLLFTQVSVGGSYFGDIFFGLALFGPGLGLSFVAGSIAALASVREEDAGLASGVNNTAFQIGAALGIAILATVAVSRTEELIASAGGQIQPALALTEGFQSAFWVGVLFAGLGLLTALLLLGLPRQARAPQPAAAEQFVKAQD